MKALDYQITDLLPYEGNARRSNVEALVDSLRANGQYRPVVLNVGTHTGRRNEILAGNHLVEAAKELGWTKISAVTVDVDDADARRIVLADNRTADLGTYDEESLAELLRSLDGDYTGTGYGEEDLVALLALVVAEEPEPDEVPEEFPSYDENLSTEHTCPKCGYAWSGQA